MRTRRTLLRAALAGGLAMPAIGWARAGEPLYVRTPGGTYDDIMRRAVYEPFRKQTGIEVIPVAATVGKLLAMFKAGTVELDVIDTGDGPLETLRRLDALAPIAYDAWTYTHKADLIADLALPTRVANFLYATAIVYNTQSFPQRHPTSWAEFWDIKAFPGPRTLPDMATGVPPLEFALLADGVKPEQLYPIDLDRAFASLTRIRAAVPKFWDTAALSAQMMSDREAVLGAMWTGRVQTVIDQGAPLALEWNQNMIQVQAYGIFKGARNLAAAQRFVDFALQPGPQAAYATALRYGPTNLRANALIDPAVLDKLSAGPRQRALGFYQQIGWWEDNRQKVNQAWSRWVLG